MLEEAEGVWRWAPAKTPFRSRCRRLLKSLRLRHLLTERLVEDCCRDARAGAQMLPRIQELIAAVNKNIKGNLRHRTVGSLRFASANLLPRCTSYVSCRSRRCATPEHLNALLVNSAAKKQRPTLLRHSKVLEFACPKCSSQSVAYPTVIKDEEYVTCRSCGAVLATLAQFRRFVASCLPSAGAPVSGC
jgi:ribosomal protein S27E